MAGAREGVAGGELLFFGRNGGPGFDGDGLIESVVFFVAIVFAVHVAASAQPCRRTCRFRHE